MRRPRLLMVAFPAPLVMVAWLGSSHAATVSMGTADWVVYEDSTIHFKHPKGFIVRDYEAPEQTHSWRLSPIHSDLAKFKIYQSRKTQEKRPLSKIAEAVRQVEKQRMTAGPTRVATPGGECLKFRTESPNTRCGPGIVLGQPAPAKRTPCIRSMSTAVCYNKKKHYFEISSAVSLYFEKGKPDAAAQDDAELFDAILDTLEFKAPDDRLGKFIEALRGWLRRIPFLRWLFKD